jgi:hypothetical protein
MPADDPVARPQQKALADSRRAQLGPGDTAPSPDPSILDTGAVADT